MAEWEGHAAAVEAERDAALDDVEEGDVELGAVSTDRDEYRDEVEAAVAGRETAVGAAEASTIN